MDKQITCTYDLEADALYIGDLNQDINDTIQITNNLIIDYNNDDAVVGVEVLSLTHLLKINVEDLIKLFNNDSIKIYLEPSDKIREFKQVYGADEWLDKLVTGTYQRNEQMD